MSFVCAFIGGVFLITAIFCAVVYAKAGALREEISDELNLPRWWGGPRV